MFFTLSNQNFTVVAVVILEHLYCPDEQRHILASVEIGAYHRNRLTSFNTYTKMQFFAIVVLAFLAVAAAFAPAGNMAR